MHDGRRTVIAAADAVADGLGLHPGMALAHAQAMVPGLLVMDADPAGDAAALARLAAWCLRLSPLTAPEGGDGLWIDATGCTHLQGGEAAMLATLLARLAADGIAARAAIADTPGAAHALARHAPDRVTIAPEGGTVAAVACLPVVALRLEPDAVATLRRLGLDRVADLAALPRAPLARRFGTGVLRRLDQALGRVAEPITPVVPPDMPQARLAFPEPLLTAESFVAVIARLVRRVCTHDGAGGAGCTAHEPAVRAGGRHGGGHPDRHGPPVARRAPSRPGCWRNRWKRWTPAWAWMRCTWPRRSRNRSAAPSWPSWRTEAEADVATLVDRLSNRLGPDRVWRAAPAQSDVPERSVMPGRRRGGARRRRLATLAPPDPAAAPAAAGADAFGAARPAPRSPSPGAATATRCAAPTDPSGSPGEWWRRDAERGAVRDYWQVEDEGGSPLLALSPRRRPGRRHGRSAMVPARGVLR